MPPAPSLLWIPEHARGLRDRGALRGKSWSLAQVCEHLALAIRGTADDSSPESRSAAASQWWTDLGALTRTRRRIMRRGLLWSGRFPEGVPSPEYVIPSNSPDLEDSIRLLEAAARQFDRKLAVPNSTWPLHPLLGPMLAREWKRFHDLHARHHFKFMRAQP